MLTRKYLTAILSFTFSFFLHAQGEEDVSASVLKRVDESRLSPNAAVIENYVSYPEISNTGMVPIEIPIYQMEDRDLSLDVKLFYNPNNLKVDSRASWVGTGWGLQAGGVITREVRDIPDDLIFESRAIFRPNLTVTFYPTAGWLELENGPAGFRSRNTVGLIEDFPKYGIEYYSEHEEDKAEKLGAAKSIDDVNDWGLDKEPDLFSVNINGRTFKFLFNEQGEIKTLGSVNDYKISFSRHDGSDYPNETYLGQDLMDYNFRIESFEITDSEGYQYTFDQVEKTINYQKYYLTYSTPSIDYGRYAIQERPSINTAWYLSKVVSPLGHEMSFQYEEEELVELVPNQTYYSNCETSDCSGSDENRVKFYSKDNLSNYDSEIIRTFYPMGLINQGDHDPVVDTIAVDQVDKRTKFKIVSKRLKSIESENLLIQFESSDYREDIPELTELDEITVDYKGSEVNDLRLHSPPRHLGDNRD
ncbi:MAG: hypothetical protein AAFY41_10525 [Bacteroidota bacterium]